MHACSYSKINSRTQRFKAVQYTHPKTSTVEPNNNHELYHFIYAKFNQIKLFFSQDGFPEHNLIYNFQVLFFLLVSISQLMLNLDLNIPNASHLPS